MFTREQLLRSPEYWFEFTQNELFRQVKQYLERTQMTQTELSAHLGVTKRYVSQISNGKSNFSLKVLIDICLALDLVPTLAFSNLTEVIAADRQKALFKIQATDQKPNLI